MARVLLTLSGASVSVLHGDHSREVFRELDLTLQMSDHLALLGPNGSGKSTIIDLIRGVRTPIAGSLHQEKGVEVAYLPQEYRSGLFPWLSGALHAEMYAGFKGGFSKKIFDSAISRLRLSDVIDQRVARLSGGEQQLLLLACVMSCRCDLYLLDEPFSAVDTERRALAADIIAEQMEATSAALVLVTHSIPDAVRLTERAIVLSGQASHHRMIVKRFGKAKYQEHLIAASVF